MLETIGRYKVLEELGRGAMAVVYKAFDPSIDRTLAIKVLRPERCEDPEYRSRFLREAKAAGVLSHPNIVTIYDIGEVDNRPYIAMAMLDGQPLDEYMESTPDRPLTDTLAIGIQLAKALNYAHNNGVVHRDVKPSNIIVGKDGSSITITDFGIAHIEDPTMTRHTQMGEVLGTPQYMSPEQALGKPTDARSDLFSVGVILYQLITGKKPFIGETIATLLLQITTTEPQPIDQLCPRVPKSVKQIVERLLNKQPERRFQSGKELADALISALADIRAAEKEKARILPIRVKWSLIMAAIVSIVMAIGATWLYQRQYAIMTQQATEYGSSMARFMATESAESVLRQDWVAIEIFVQGVMSGQQFNYLTLVDSHGVIRGSSIQGSAGQTYQKIIGGKPFAKTADVTIQRYQVSKSSDMLDFDAPIMFHNKEIGHIHLGMLWDPIGRLAEQTVITMIVLMIVTVIAAAFVAYLLASGLSRPMHALLKGLDEIRKGNLSYRIAQTRTDEFGQLFQSFDDMAESLGEGAFRPNTPAEH